MKTTITIKDLESQLLNLQIALKNKEISTNQYCDTYYKISQQIKSIN